MNAKLFAISYDPVTYKGEKGMDAMPAIRFFLNFEKTVHSLGLKLSVAVHSSFVKVLICQLCAHHF